MDPHQDWSTDKGKTPMCLEEANYWPPEPYYTDNLWMRNQIYSEHTSIAPGSMESIHTTFGNQLPQHNEMPTPQTTLQANTSLVEPNKAWRQSLPAKTAQTPSPAIGFLSNFKATYVVTASRDQRKDAKRLTPEEKTQICLEAEKNPKLTAKRIAAKHGVERSTVTKILQHKNKYLEKPSKEEIIRQLSTLKLLFELNPDIAEADGHDMIERLIKKLNRL